MNFEYDENVTQILETAADEARYLNHAYVVPEHVLFALIQQPPVKFLFEAMQVDMPTLKRDILRHLLNSENFLVTSPEVVKKNYKLEFSREYKQLIEKCCLSCARDKRTVVTMRDLIAALIEIEEEQKTFFLKERNITVENIINSLKYKKLSKLLEITKTREEDEVELDLEEELEELQLKDDPFDFHESPAEDPAKILENYTTNLTATAETTSTDIFVGQNNIIKEIFEVLMRRSKNNVLLLGDPGVGKTALVSEIAKRIVKGNVPKEFKNVTLLSLNVMTLVAGTRYRGDFEDRVKQLIQTLSGEKKDYILLLDDMKTVLNSGASSSNTNDFGDLIKPILLNNDLRCIGVSTFDEYKRLEQERSIFRRFHTIEMNEPSHEEMLKILGKVKDKYEKFYKIKYPDEIFKTIIDLTSKYILDKFFPDKALDILDAVGSAIKLHNHAAKKNKIKVVSISDVEKIISKMTKRSLTSVKKNELSELLQLESKLKQKIFGQDQQIRKVANIVSRAKAGLNDEFKPLASLLFVGPTGVGKTELCKQLSVELELPFHRFDMSEFQEQSSVAKFIGSPPGYVGHSQGGLLIDYVRRQPYSVLLLDEIEKAHIDVFNLLLQVMDYATITDGLGRKADFRNVLLCMTSNAGAELALQSRIGFMGEKHGGSSAMTEALAKIFRPEFRNRLDDTIIFNSLTIVDIRKIVETELENLRQKLQKHAMTLVWNDDIVEHLAAKGFSEFFGARNIKRVINTEIHDILSIPVLKRISRKNTESPRDSLFELELIKKKVVVRNRTYKTSNSNEKV